MGKVLNRKGQFGRTAASEDRSGYWKHGKTSGDGKHQEKKARKLAKRSKKLENP